MTARPQDVALLPFPEFVPIGSSWNDTILNFAANYARANVTAAIASAQAREDELRAEVADLRQQNRQLRDCICADAKGRFSGELARAKARAERLEEALRDERAAERSVEAARSAGWRPAYEGEEEAYYERLLAAQDAYQNARARTDALSTNAATQTGETNEAAQ